MIELVLVLSMHVVGVLLVVLLIGMVLGYLLATMVSNARGKAKLEVKASQSKTVSTQSRCLPRRTIGTQSQCTYQRKLVKPRFSVLPQRADGAFEASTLSPLVED